MSAPARLHVALGPYPHVAALRSGEVGSDLLTLDFADLTVMNRAFAPMVRAARYDVSEMAIATFLQARAFGKDLVLLPVTMAARFQEAALLCRTGSNISGPADLAGRRVGVRAYSQTTGMWLRGELADAFGLAAQDVRWVTFEGAHVAEYADPRWTERAADGADMLAMLRGNELDAVIVGNDVPEDPGLRTVFADPAAAGRDFLARYGLVPVNHLVCVRGALARERPELIAELVRMLGAARDSAGLSAERRAALPFGRAALAPAITLALRFCAEQTLLPRKLSLDEVWEGLAAGL